MKNTRLPPADSWNCPGATLSMSLRLSKRSRSFCDCWWAHGQPNSASAAIISSTGQTNRSRGQRNTPSPCPAENQITISLSRYMRDKVPTMAMNRLKVRIVGAWPSTV